MERGKKMTKEMAIKILRGDVFGTNEQTHEAVFMAIKALKEQAQIDAVEVVRCKDCKKCFYDDLLDIYWCGEKDMSADDYCSWGVRKEDET